MISYDRLIAGGDLAYYVSFDNELVGTLQATAFVDALDATGDDSAGILMVNGSPTDNNATLFAAGAHDVIDRTDLRILAEYETPDWSPDKAQEWVAGQISQYGDSIAGRVRGQRRDRERGDRGASTRRTSSRSRSSPARTPSSRRSSAS